MVHTYYMVCVNVCWLSNWCSRGLHKSFKGLRLPVMETDFHQWFLEAALQLKIYTYITPILTLKNVINTEHTMFCKKTLNSSSYFSKFKIYTNIIPILPLKSVINTNHAIFSQKNHSKLSFFLVIFYIYFEFYLIENRKKNLLYWKKPTFIFYYNASRYEYDKAIINTGYESP